MQELITNAKELAFKMRQKALEMALNAGGKGSHLGPALSCMEILAALYGGVMTFQTDRFIPSKAHCVLAYYTALAYSGHFPVKELDTFECNDSKLSGHPVMNDEWGIEFSGGSLGMGLSQGVGLALAAKRKNKQGKVFVLVGDGECNEGSVWEAVMSAAQFKLDNLIMIVDSNKLQYDGAVEKIMSISPLKEKLQSFGFKVIEIENANDAAQTVAGLCKAKNVEEQPCAVIANTVKGCGVSFMENRKEWHHSRLSKEQYDIALQELLQRGAR